MPNPMESPEISTEALTHLLDKDAKELSKEEMTLVVSILREKRHLWQQEEQKQKPKRSGQKKSKEQVAAALDGLTDDLDVDLV